MRRRGRLHGLWRQPLACAALPPQATSKSAMPVVHMQRVAGGRSPTGDSPAAVRPVSPGSAGSTATRPRGYQPRSLDMKPVCLGSGERADLAGQLVVTPTRVQY